MSPRRRTRRFGRIDRIQDRISRLSVSIVSFLFGVFYRRRVIQDFLEHVRIAVNRGLPLAEGVERYAGSHPPGAVRSVLFSITDHLRAGEPLWTGLRDHSPAFFPPDTVAMVRAGEKSGNLKQALANVVEDLTFRREVKIRFTYTCVYLLGLTLLVFLWIGFLAVFILPRYAEFWAEVEAPLPWPTALLTDPPGVWIGGRYLNFGAAVVPLVVILVFIFSRFLQGIPSGVASIVPGLRGAFIRHQTGGFLAALGMYLAARTPTDRAVTAAAEASRLSRIREGAGKAAAGVRKKIPLGEALGTTKTLREDLLWRIRSAERRGDLPETLLALGSEEQEAANRRFLYFIGWFRPLSIVALGCLEMMLVLAVYYPVFQIADLIPMEYL